MSDLQRTNTGDHRLTVMLCLLCGLLFFDLLSGPYGNVFKQDKENVPHVYLHFADPLQLVVVTSSEGNERPVPAHYTPVFFLPVPINNANKELLMTIKGIGPALADKIVSYREQFGPFKDSLDLQKLPGVGARRAANLTTELTFIEAP